MVSTRCQPIRHLQLGGEASSLLGHCPTAPSGRVVGPASQAQSSGRAGCPRFVTWAWVSSPAALWGFCQGLAAASRPRRGSVSGTWTAL